MVRIVKNADILALYAERLATNEEHGDTNQANGDQVGIETQHIVAYPAKKIQLVDGRYRVVDPE